MTTPRKDTALVTPDGSPIIDLIDGVNIRYARTQTDDRGTLTEILNPAWGYHPDPIVYVYQVTVRPGIIKGWHQHRLHDDRVFLSQGELKVVLYDDRPTSPTYQKINELYLSHYHRAIITFPAYVWHALHNVGQIDALLVSCPTCSYDHDNPDVYRLPVNNDHIPYRFDPVIGY